MLTEIRKWFAPDARRLKCAAVTPIGPGHVERARECRASIEAAWRHHRGPFTELEFCFIDDSRGQLGRSKARNVGVQAAREAGADWIFFLDADDLMTPRAFSIFAGYCEQFDAVWGLMAIKPSGEPDHHIRFPQALTLRSVDELLLLDPFITLLMGHFVRTSAALELAFDEAMDAGEDFDYYIRAWERYRCTKLAEVLSVNRSDRHSSGPRAATADEWRAAATARLAAGMQKRGLHPCSSGAIAAVNRCSQEAQAFSRARNEASADTLELFAARLPYRGFVDVSGCQGGDFVMFSNNDDRVALSLGWTGEYLPASTRLWQALCTNATLILDLGAGTGYFSLLAARAAPAADIVCFEQQSGDFSRLELNIESNAARNVRALRAETSSVDSFLAAQNTMAPLLVRVNAERLAGNVGDGMEQIFKRSMADLLITVDDAAFAQRIDRELRQRGYRFYAVDETAESVVMSERLTPANGNSNVNHWATTRPAEEAARIIATAYCR